MIRMARQLDLRQLQLQVFLDQQPVDEFPYIHHQCRRTNRHSWRVWVRHRHQVQNQRVARAHTRAAPVKVEVPVKVVAPARVEVQAKVRVEAEVVVKAMVLERRVPRAAADHRRRQVDLQVAVTLAAIQGAAVVVVVAGLQEAVVVLIVKRTSTIRLREQAQTTTRHKEQVILLREARDWVNRHKANLQFLKRNIDSKGDLLNGDRL